MNRLAAVFAFGLLSPFIAHTVLAEISHPPKGVKMPACEEEDSRNCYWNAATMGNGMGRSFVDVNGVTIFVDFDR
jgi:hypothetical protein